MTNSIEINRNQETQLADEAIAWIIRHPIMRHGETTANNQGLLQGATDHLETTNLTIEANEQTIQIAEQLHQFSPPVTKIVTSNLGRSIQTGAIIATHLKIQAESHEGFNEYNYGEWEMTPKQQYFDKEWIKNRVSGTDGPKNGEDFLSFLNRVQDAISQAHTTYRENSGSILFILHAEVIRAIRFLAYLQSQGITTLNQASIEPHQAHFSFIDGGDAFLNMPHFPQQISSDSSFSPLLSQ